MAGHRVAGDIRYYEFRMQRPHLYVKYECLYYNSLTRIVLVHATLLGNAWLGL